MKNSLFHYSFVALFLWVLNLPGQSGPVKVFILAGQSNMEGHAVVDLDGKNYNDGKGTLNTILKNPGMEKWKKNLLDGTGGVKTREDVWVRYQRENRPLLAGPLSVGFTIYGDKHHFGPELAFGLVLGDHFTNPVLLIKTAWGGKSLYKDFRPPSSGGTGPYYTKMLSEIRQGLESLKKDFPAYQGQGYEIAGLVWYQGWNDGVDPKNAVPEYEKNLVNFINDIRKDLQTPKLPVVVGELTGPWGKAPGAWDTLRKAQKAAAEKPEFKGNALFVATGEFVRPPADSPNPGHGHHEFGNAETGILVGEALAKGMLQLLQSEKNVKDDKPTSHVEKEVEGWKVRIDSRLLEPARAAQLETALRFLSGKLADIKRVVPQEKIILLQKVVIVLDLTHGNLKSMQYHPGSDWLKQNGYSTNLVKCVHLPRIEDLATKRNTNEQPWVILHELAHAFHDQVLGFEEPRVREVFEEYKKSGRGEKALLFDGRKVKHYALTNHKEFFAEMTEAYFGVNDFFPFTRGELKESEPAIHQLMRTIWEEKPKQASTTIK